jgi:hypothetical protein
VGLANLGSESETCVGSRVRLVGVSICFEKNFYRLPFTSPSMVRRIGPSPFRHGRRPDFAGSTAWRTGRRNPCQAATEAEQRWIVRVLSVSCAQDGSRAGPEHRRITAVPEYRPVVGCETCGDVRPNFVPSVGWVVVWGRWWVTKKLRFWQKHSPKCDFCTS